MDTADPEAAVPASQMEKNTSPSTPLVPLPLCDGPKLGPFTQNFEDLMFETELVIRGGEGEYAHGMVIKAKLDGKTYGIKFFIERIGLFNPEHHPGLSQDEIALARMQSDPFFAECRAYGRLQEEGVEHLAAKAYGYVQFHITERTKEMFKPAMAMAFNGDWDGLRDFMNHYDQFPDASSPSGISIRPATRPIYGIVKEWAGGDKEHDVAWRWAQPYVDQMAAEQRTLDLLPRQLEYLHELHRHGIVVRDLHGAQWVEGKLVDLSYAWTVPHILGQGDRNRPDWTFASYAARDLFMFQHVINCANQAVDHSADRLHREGVLGPFKKSTLVAYPTPESVVKAPGPEDRKPKPIPNVRRQGLRPLPHRLIQSYGDKETEEEELPLLLYTQRYDPDSPDRFRGWVPWTYGPLWDPARFASQKENRQEAGPLDVLEGYTIARAVARQVQGSKMKTKSKEKAVVGEKTRVKPRTKVTKTRKKRTKVV
ncbi:hypothetical protein F5X68DRAFT_187422 [Plectosphaerella plurivora]|uniref:Uncharacterized protein n=1 Tax=Plectosphaerella plurivora TaxID=936078 RepID=A0A9P8VHK1_9PEZI|nr:hypothetical protein F5X68DRAFT_187422 [Plectosphaerella plurivora]